MRGGGPLDRVVGGVKDGCGGCDSCDGCGGCVACGGCDSTAASLSFVVKEVSGGSRDVDAGAAIASSGVVVVVAAAAAAAAAAAESSVTAPAGSPIASSAVDGLPVAAETAFIATSGEMDIGDPLPSRVDCCSALAAAVE